MAPAAGIDGTFTQRLALEPPAFQLSIQYGSRVTPSLAVNRMSPPFDCALVKSNPEPNTTFSWYPVNVVPPALAIVTALRYCQLELSQLTVCAVTPNEAVFVEPL